jgi:probable F420-dependent oxidoreductase
MDLSRLGVFCFLDPLPGAALGPFAKKVERLGYSALWFAEGVGRESLSLATHLLDQTRTLVIGSGIAVAYSREPIAAANAARALSELFPDRFILGLGVSNAAANERRGVRYEPPVEFMKSYLARMKAAPYMAPAPAAEAPVVLGSFLPQMVRLAAEETAGVLTYFTPPEKTAQVRAEIGPRKWLCAEQAVILETDPLRARAAARQYMAFYLAIPHYAKLLGPLGFPRRTSQAGAIAWSTPSWPGAPWQPCARESPPTSPRAPPTCAYCRCGPTGVERRTRPFSRPSPLVG